MPLMGMERRSVKIPRAASSGFLFVKHAVHVPNRAQGRFAYFWHRQKPIEKSSTKNPKNNHRDSKGAKQLKNLKPHQMSFRRSNTTEKSNLSRFLKPKTLHAPLFLQYPINCIFATNFFDCPLHLFPIDMKSLPSSGN